MVGWPTPNKARRPTLSLTEIQTGQFAKEWILENKANQPTFLAIRRRDRNHLIEKVGKELRSMMPWIEAKVV